jgi:hydroxymethylbilane synthase
MHVCVRTWYQVVNFRGNVQTRLRKLDEDEVDATMLAYAGLKRLNMAHVATHILSQEDMLPAVSQGAIGIQCREGDATMLKYLDALNCPNTKVRDGQQKLWGLWAQSGGGGVA